MKSFFEQFGGTYQKENNYAIPNLEMPNTENFESGIGAKLMPFFQLRKWKNSFVYGTMKSTYIGMDRKYKRQNKA